MHQKRYLYFPSLFSISFVCLVVILLILCVIPPWDSATAYTPSGKELSLFLSERCQFFRAFYIGKLISLYPASSLFGTQQQLAHPPVKSSTLPLRKMPVHQGAAPRHTILTSSCVIPLWDSATAHSPSGKEFNPSSQEDARVSGRCSLAYNFNFILHHPSLGLSKCSLTLWSRAHLFLSGRIIFLRAHCCVIFSPVWALFDLVITHITH